ncbi:MAG: diguanylate cyclase [Planctomycetia bacterium]|nr:diguanylate cyclase [Planctomycetia bacterium]
MPWMPDPTAPPTPVHGTAWWFWLTLSVVPDVLLVAGLIGVWRHLARARRSLAERQVGELETARRLKIIAENASDVVMETDNDGIIRWVTPLILQRIGLRPEDVVGTPYARLVHPDDRETVRSMEQEVQSGTAAESDLRLRLADGSYRWFSLSLRPVFDAAHAVVGRVSGWRDVHDAVQARNAAAAVRRRLDAQMTSMITPLMLGEPVRDDAGRVVDFAVADANPPACAFFKLDRERLVGRHLLELLPQMATTGLIARFADTADTGRLTEIDDFPLPMPDGSIRTLDMRAARADAWISFVVRDNTEKVAALEKIKASEERFRLLAENSLDVVVRIDTNDRLVWVSPSITGALGWTPAECIGRRGIDFLATEQTREQYRRDKARVFAGGGAVSRAQVRSKTGEVHWMETHSSPFRMPDGHIDGVVASMRIIDPQVRAEQALERRARIDDLTRLLNRTELMDRLGGLVERGDGDVAVLWCDIDRFKTVNDAHGHAAGDAVLRALGDRIRACLSKPEDLGARIGGDELLVVLCGARDLGAAAAIAETLRRSAAEPIPFDGDTIETTLSIGVTLAVAGEGVDALLARADDAMYQAKEQGRNRVVALPAEAGSPSG